MFGFMRMRCGAPSAEERLRRRMHYCGACKTLGTLYGQRSRLLLNFDAVFLGELLSALSGDSNPASVPELRSYRCLKLPRSAESIPLPLQYAATANIVLAEFKARDRMEDSRGRLAHWAFATLSRSFQRAERKLSEWEFPIEDLRAALASQRQREAAAESAPFDPSSTLASCSEPTACATALFFAEGARICRAPGAVERMTEIGRAFGEMIYLLDALEDYRSDQRNGAFNAIRACWRIDGAEMPAEIRSAVTSCIRASARRMTDGVRALPIPDELGRLFASRIQHNLARRLGTPLEFRCGPPIPAVSPPPIRMRWREAITVGGALAQARVAESPSLWRRASAPLLFSSAVAMALAFPTQARDAANYGECMDAGFNLMAIGGLVGAIAAAPIRWLPRRKASACQGADGTLALSNMEPGPTHSRTVRRVRRTGGRPPFVCFCCPADCCECCCLTELCGECTCEGLACAEGCGGCCESGCCEAAACCGP